MKTGNTGISSLYRIESVFNEEYDCDDYDGYVVSRFGGQTSDYMEQYKNTSYFERAWNWMYNTWFGNKPKKITTAFNDIKLRKCDPKTYCKARFQPADPDWNNAFYMNKMMDMLLQKRNS